MRHFTHTNEHTYSYIATFARHNIHRYSPVESAKSCRPHYTHTHAHPHLLSTQHELTDYNKTGACTSTTTQVDSCVHQSPVMNIITPATNRLCTVDRREQHTTLQQVSICHKNIHLFFSLSIQSKERGACVAERGLFAGKDRGGSVGVCMCAM